MEFVELVRNEALKVKEEYDQILSAKHELFRSLIKISNEVELLNKMLVFNGKTPVTIEPTQKE